MMRPHSTSAQVDQAIKEVKDRTRTYITTPDARAIVSWYVTPDRTPYMLQFAQGRNVNAQGLLLEVLGTTQEMWDEDVNEHSHLLYAIAFLGMRVGMTTIIEEHE